MQAILYNSLFAVVLALLIIFAYLFFRMRDKYSKKSDEYLELADNKGFFTKKSSVMRNDERILFDILMKQYSDKYYIFPQMSLSNVLDVKEESKDHDNLFHEINKRILDFIFFDKITLAPVLVIELNGGSHMMLNRKNKDKILENLLENAKVPFLPIEKQLTYNTLSIFEEINKKVSTANN